MIIGLRSAVIIWIFVFHIIISVFLCVTQSTEYNGMYINWVAQASFPNPTLTSRYIVLGCVCVRLCRVRYADTAVSRTIFEPTTKQTKRTYWACRWILSAVILTFTPITGNWILYLRIFTVWMRGANVIQSVNSIYRTNTRKKIYSKSHNIRD